MNVGPQPRQHGPDRQVGGSREHLMGYGTNGPTHQGPEMDQSQARRDGGIVEGVFGDPAMAIPVRRDRDTGIGGGRQTQSGGAGTLPDDSEQDCFSQPSEEVRMSADGMRIQGRSSSGRKSSRWML